MTEMLERVNGFVWGVPVLGLLLSAGLWLTWKTRGVQLRQLPKALGEFGRSIAGRGGDGSFRALCTALAATVGTGNIAAVAGAIAIGGPGAVFWMWISGLLGMALKYAEGMLAAAYRIRGKDGTFRGGPMYYMTVGLGERWRPLAVVYCVLGIGASFGVGNAAQISAVLSAGEAAAEGFGCEISFTGRLLVAAVLAAAVLVLVGRGAGSVGDAAETLVPLAAAGYIALCLLALWLRRSEIPAALGSILTGAFSPRGVTGGAVGSVLTTLRIGVSRGTFTHEAGMGTAAIAHGGADVADPARQGRMGLVEVFLDTMVICTLTALVILTGGVPVPYGIDAGAELTAAALGERFGPWAGVALWLFLSLFALATVLGWSFYAGRCGEFLFGRIRWRWFALAQGLCVLLSAAVEADAVWTVSELLNGLMAVPNLLAVTALAPRLGRLTVGRECGIIGTRENDTAR